MNKNGHSNDFAIQPEVKRFYIPQNNERIEHCHQFLIVVIVDYCPFQIVAQPK